MRTFNFFALEYLIVFLEHQLILGYLEFLNNLQFKGMNTLIFSFDFSFLFSNPTSKEKFRKGLYNKILKENKTSIEDVYTRLLKKKIRFN